MRALIVEDNAELREFLCVSLAEVGIEAFGLAGENSDEIARRIENDECDIVVVDSVLGEGDGIALTQRLRSGEKGRAIPVVLMSPVGTSLARRMATNAGCNEFLVKPFGFSRLIESLRRLA